MSIKGPDCIAECAVPELSIVIPFRSTRSGALAGLVARWLPLAAERVEVIICDGSPGAVFTDECDRSGRALRHIPVDRAHFSYANNKVNGVCTGIEAARADLILTCDDDCMLTLDQLELLLDAAPGDCALKIPTRPEKLTPGELIDVVRSVICHGIAPHREPSPVFLARRRILLAGLRDGAGDCLFDDYMLGRALQRAGTVLTYTEVGLLRAASPSAKCVEQQVRYAYEDLSALMKTAGFLALPALAAGLAVLGARFLATGLGVALVASLATAARGWRLAPVGQRWPAWIIILAPIWMMIRACAVPIALTFLLTGGFPYGGRRIRSPARIRLWEW